MLPSQQDKADFAAGLVAVADAACDRAQVAGYYADGGVFVVVHVVGVADVDASDCGSPAQAPDVETAVVISVVLNAVVVDLHHAFGAAAAPDTDDELELQLGAVGVPLRVRVDVTDARFLLALRAQARPLNNPPAWGWTGQTQRTCV